MPVITEREKVQEVLDNAVNKRVSLGIFGAASHWNAEAAILAADRFAKRHNIRNIPVVVSMTYTYGHMPQAERITRSGDPASGFVSVMEHVRILCDGKDAPYSNVVVLPHLDHADPVRDKWALTEGLPYLASVMFDAQKYPYRDNIRMTREYVERYGKDVLIEGIMDTLSVHGGGTAVRNSDDYVERAVGYVKSTNVDFLVADLGTEQQATATGESRYLKQRARELTDSLGRPMLVLHGTSSLDENQIRGLFEDGVARVNMWTRIAWEAGRYAAERLMGRMDAVRRGDFEATESRQYIHDNIDRAAEIMEHMMELFGYSNLAK